MPSPSARSCLVGCQSLISRVEEKGCGEDTLEKLEECLRIQCPGTTDSESAQARTLFNAICSSDSSQKSTEDSVAASTKPSYITSNDSRYSLRVRDTPPHSTTPSPSLTESLQTNTPSLQQQETTTPLPPPLPPPQSDDKGNVPILYVGIICGLSAFIMIVFIIALIWHLRKKRKEIRELDLRIQRAKEYRDTVLPRKTATGGGVQASIVSTDTRSAEKSPVSPADSRSESIWVKLDEKIYGEREEVFARGRGRSILQQQQDAARSAGGRAMVGRNLGVELSAQPISYYELEAQEVPTPPIPIMRMR